jgi:gliding motility-associated-like protein
MSQISKGNLSYLWYFGDQDSSLQANPKHSYLTHDTFTVQMIAVSEQKCRDTSQKTLVVHPQPMAAFTVNDTAQCYNENHYIFSNTSGIAYGNLTHVWDFGDGSISYSKNPQTSYKYEDTVFLVSLQVISEDGCMDAFSRNIVVWPSPQADFEINNSVQCLKGNEFRFYDKSHIASGILNYLYDFGKHQDSANANPVYSYDSAGKYEVMLIVRSQSGCMDTARRTTWIHSNPKIEIKVNSPEQCLDANQFNFEIINTATDVDPDSLQYSWYFGDGENTSIPKPDHSYSQSGTYISSIRAETKQGCIDSVTKLIRVHPNPKAFFTHSRACLGKSVKFISRSQIAPPGMIFENIWDYGNGHIDYSKDSGTCTFQDTGYHAILLTVISDQGCKDSFSKRLYFADHVSAVELERATVWENEEILIEWELPEKGHPFTYLIEKSRNNESFYQAAVLGALVQKYQDKKVDVQRNTYTYRIKSIDSCDHESSYSNWGKTIHLEADSLGEYTELHWTAYSEWKEGVKEYKIQLYNSNTGTYLDIGSTLPGERNFVHKSSELDGAWYCYRIAALRYGDALESYSNRLCLSTDFSLHIPNAFSPNGDGVNDAFYVKGTFVREFQMKIYDRWGTLIFETDEMEAGWDGMYNGELCPVGVYMVYIYARGTQRENTIDKAFTVLLMR